MFLKVHSMNLSWTPKKFIKKLKNSKDSLENQKKKKCITSGEPFWILNKTKQKTKNKQTNKKTKQNKKNKKT